MTVRTTGRVRTASTVRLALRSDALATSLRVFVLTRILFLLLTYFGVVLFGSVLHGPHPSFLHQLLPRWGQWDTLWYIQIAERGYAWRKAVGTSPTAFFPLYPLLIRGGIDLIHRSALTVALLVSNLCFLAALVYLWKLARWEFDRAVADRTVLYIAVFPTALFFFAGYTESLFLLTTVAAFYYLRRRHWILAGVFVALAGATRVTGILLLLPLAYEYGRDHNFSLRRIDRGALGLLIAPLGLLAFMAYLKWTVGDALAFTQSQVAWQKIFTLELWRGFAASVVQIVTLPPASFYQAHNIINIVLGGLFLILSVVAVRRLPASYILYIAAFWVVTLTSPALAGGYPVPLISLSRYILALFPLFMIMARAGEDRAVNDTYLVLSVGMLAVFTVQFVNGGWII